MGVPFVIKLTTTEIIRLYVFVVWDSIVGEKTCASWEQRVDLFSWLNVERLSVKTHVNDAGKCMCTALPHDLTQRPSMIYTNTFYRFVKNVQKGSDIRSTNVS